MAKPVFEPLSGTRRQDSLTQLTAERSEDLSELQQAAVLKGDGAGGPATRPEALTVPVGSSDETIGRADAQGQIKVQVCYATPEVQTVMTVSVEVPCTVKAVLHASGLLVRHPEIDLSVQAVGIFGKIKQLDDVVSAEDRIEIYRPLIVDPKVARARRVAKTRKGGSSEGRKWATRARRSL